MNRNNRKQTSQQRKQTTMSSVYGTIHFWILKKEKIKSIEESPDETQDHITHDTET